MISGCMRDTEVTKTDRLEERSPARWAIAVFAHNEEQDIVNALESVRNSASIAQVHAYVLINGCTDRTESVVENYAQRNEWVTPISIELGDKANAWNLFVYQVAGDYDAYFFADGDVEIEPHALNALYEELMGSPGANAAAAVPCSGRHRDQMTTYVTESRLILGNLYALRREFIQRVRKAGTRIPVGMIGDDGIITSLVKWDLDPTGEFKDERVAPCIHGKFKYRSLSPWSLSDLRTYWRRRVRYSLRHYQHELLVPILRQGGIRAMPKSTTDLYIAQKQCIAGLRPRHGLDSFFDRIALREIRASAGAR